MNEQYLKKNLRNWVKKSAVSSELGEVFVGTLSGEKGNALVYNSPFAEGLLSSF